MKDKNRRKPRRRARTKAWGIQYPDGWMSPYRLASNPADVWSGFFHDMEGLYVDAVRAYVQARNGVHNDPDLWKKRKALALVSRRLRDRYKRKGYACVPVWVVRR